MNSESILHYKDILIVLGTAGLIIPVLLRFGISSILGFLIVGLLLGPHVLGEFAKHVPAVSALAPSDSHNASGLAELGVVSCCF